MDVFLVKTYSPYGNGALIERFDGFPNGLAGARRAASGLGSDLMEVPQQRSEKYVWQTRNETPWVALYRINAADIPAEAVFGSVTRFKNLVWMRAGEIVPVGDQERIGQ